MFTGLVETTCRVLAIREAGPGIELWLKVPRKVVRQEQHHGLTRIGDSVAINGCCLTVVKIEDQAVAVSDISEAMPLPDETWVFEAGSETLSKTNLGTLKAGDIVNIERALPANGRLGGHFVQGHVDGTGKVSQILHEGNWVFMHFECDQTLTAMMVPKGSITVDGISLTLVTVTDSDFSVALIPHTLDATTLGKREVGDLVNVETDVLGKYVAKFLSNSQKN